MSGWFKGLVRNTFIHADDREGKDERKVKSWGAGDQAPVVEQKDVRLLDGMDHLSAINEECGVSDAAASVIGDHASNMGDPYGSVADPAYGSMADPAYGMAEPAYGSDSHPLHDWKEQEQVKEQESVPYVDSAISGPVVVDKMDLASSTDVTDEPAKVDPSAVDLPSPLQKLADAQAEMMMQQAALYQAQTRYFEEMTRRAEEQRQGGESRSSLAQPQYVGTEGLMPPMPMPAPFMPVQTWPPMYVGAPMMPMQMELTPQQQQQEQQQAFLDPAANDADKGKQQEEPWQRERDAPQALHCTTLMMRNLPNCYTREMVCGLLNDTGSRGRYDFLYLPLDGKRGEPTNKGYCFINFRVHEGALGAWTALEGFDRWKDVASSKKITFHWAKEAQQGLDANVERYRNSPIMHDDVDKQFKPAMFDEEGNEATFPKPDKPFKKQRLPWPLRHHGGKGKDGGASTAAPQ